MKRSINLSCQNCCWGSAPPGLACFNNVGGWYLEKFGIPLTERIQGGYECLIEPHSYTKLLAERLYLHGFSEEGNRKELTQFLRAMVPNWPLSDCKAKGLLSLSRARNDPSSPVYHIAKFIHAVATAWSRLCRKKV